MTKHYTLLLISVFFALTSAHAQFETQVEGIEAGSFILRPAVELTGAHDSRVLRSITGSDAVSDQYTDTAAILEVVNWPARYDMRIFGRYGFRTYLDNNGLNDDFYTLRGRLKTDNKPLLWELASDYSKSLDYNLVYDPDTGTEPDDILSLRRTRLQSRGRISYDTQRFARTALVPSYTIQHNFYDYEARDEDEWITHTGILRLRYRYSAKLNIYGGAVYQFQSAEEEDGSIGSLVAGFYHRTTDKTSLRGELGYALADYERSGNDSSFVSNLRGNWQPLTKLSTYVFGGNSYQPGYSGNAARMVYRLGYGITWEITEKYNIGASVLHDYQDAIGSTATIRSYNTLRHFYDLKASYKPLERLSFVTGLRINDDQYDEMQTVLSLKAVYEFY